MLKKIETLGIPIFTGHTIKQAHGENQVEGATIIQLDDTWKEIKGTEKYFDCDSICLAVGLSPLNELLWQAGCDFEHSSILGEVSSFDKFRQTSNHDIFVAGDCAVIGEASIARLEGRIAGLKASLDLGYSHSNFNQLIDNSFHLLENIQAGSFGEKLGIGKAQITNSVMTKKFIPKSYSQTISKNDFSGKEKRIIIECNQDIPCNPCEASCKFNAIKIGNKINQQPSIDNNLCKGCGLCLTACPGRAIRLLQYNYDEDLSAITIPFEFYPHPKIGDNVEVLDSKGEFLVYGKVLLSKPSKKKINCGTISFTLKKEYAFTATALKVIKKSQSRPIHSAQTTKQTNYVCRCEEVTREDIINLINDGHHNINDIKRLKRVGMGQCRGLSCTSVVENILREKLNKTKKEILQVKQNRRTIFRPPIKRITLKEAAKLKFSKEEIKLFEGIETVRTIPQEIINTFTTKDINSSETKSSKIVIIGGGISGIFTAWWLAKLGETDVTVVESNFLSGGQTGACLGGIRTGFNILNKVKRAQKGLETFKNSKELIGEDVGWYQGGYVYLSFNETQTNLFKDSFKIWENANVNFEYISDKNSFSKYVPGVNSKRIESLVYFPESGGANPFRAIYMFAKDASKRGVKFLTNHEIIDIEKNNNKINSVTILDKHKKIYKKIKCENVVNAAGTNSVKISKMVGIDLSAQIWIERHGAFITEKMPLWLDPLVVSYHPELSGYWQQKRMEEGVKEGEIVACYSSSRPIKGFNTHSYIYFLSRMAKSILLCQPSMEDVGIIRNFAEHYVGRKSGIPIIGDTSVKGYWHNIAKKGHGFMCAPGDGYALAKTILSNKRHEWIDECTLEDNNSSLETMK